ncbi:GNAT family N-acetyltransferase [Bernardetia sp. OM2101]|uniref:GNAT family N-acetyltransferase n=1 Tax=Bernardetia sp. OM2101 TaxID=3344876 RepID=UPI0035CEDF4A
MNSNLEIKLLLDTSQLQKIYDLRVIAYENSEQSVHINKTLYPNGWSDELDEKEDVFHWIVRDNNKLVASARLVVLENLNETDGEFEEYSSLIPLERPFVYWSRLVVHPDYRRKGIRIELDKMRKSFLSKNPHIKFALTSVVETRKKHLLQLGFEHLGDTICDWNGTTRKFCLFLYRNTKTV